MSLIFALKVSLRSAQKAIEFLKQKKLLLFGFRPLKENDFIFFPLQKMPFAQQKTQLKKLFKEFDVLKKDFSKTKKKPNSLKEALKGKLSVKEFSHLIRAFDFLGNIAVIEIPKELEKKEKLIAKALLEVNKSIKTVCKITGEHSGRFRVQPIKVLAGKKTTIAEYKEAGCRMFVDISKVFFSPRLSHERERISKLIKKDEVVGAFFAGVGPFPLVFAKNSEMKKAIAIELNPDAVELMEKNIALNKVEEKIEPVLGDVKEVAKRFPKTFDRIVMPLPEGGEHFLDAAFCSIKSGGTVHFYQFESKEEPFTLPLQRIKETAKKFKKKVHILRKARVRDFSPKTIQVVIDFIIK